MRKIRPPGQENKMNIGVLDYGAGNLKNVCRAIEHLGYDYQLITSPKGVINAEKLIIPGVGAFKVAMEQLEALELIEPIKELAEMSVPIMGICLGMQLLFERSSEFGSTKGLGILTGVINLIPDINSIGNRVKVPHVGWNELIVDNLESSIIDDLSENEAVYFVHSYRVEEFDKAEIVAHCTYNCLKIPAIIQRKNVLGCQLHPEKSGTVGLKILKSFLQN
jgi:glutamine amidotransferase